MLYHCVMIYYGIPGNTVVKNLPSNAGGTGDASLTPGLGRSPRVGNGNPLQCSCLGKFHGWRGLAGYNPWGCKELDTTELLSTHTHIALLCSDGKLVLIIPQ